LDKTKRRSLPEELRRNHARIYTAANEYACTDGWNPELDDEDQESVRIVMFATAKTKIDS
jgi:hypothetical protein